jgi:D-3-phosphoglycerate dehydrogenase
MKKGSFVINCSRGGIVNETDVLQALETGQLERAAFDVFTEEPPKGPNPLFQHPKVVCTPHLGASTVEAQNRVATTAASQIVGFFQNGNRTGVIN